MNFQVVTSQRSVNYDDGLFVVFRYADIISKAQERHKKLDESIKQHGMLREAKEVESWIQDKVGILVSKLKTVSCITSNSRIRTAS